LVNILCPLSDDIYVVTGNVDYVTIKTNKKRIHSYENYYKKSKSSLVQFIRYLGLQLKISFISCKLSKRIDFFIFFMEGVGLLPMLTARLLRKKVVWIVPSAILMKSMKFHGRSLHGLFVYLQTICSILSNKIVVYSPNLIKEWNLGKFRDKIQIAHEHFLDFNRFKVTKKYDERDNLVGHIGRLSEEKGTLNFVKAIPTILE
jgi:glycosyltransferase involved in cell wall biosynthesis